LGKKAVSGMMLTLLLISTLTLAFNVKTVRAEEYSTLHFRAWIDGSDWLYIQGNEIWYVHRYFQFPGIWGEANWPTYINTDEWYPEWPDLWGYDDYGQRSLNTYTDLYPPLYNVISLTIIEARWSISIVQYPSIENDYTTIILLDDDPPGGAAWYEFELSYTSLISATIDIDPNTLNLKSRGQWITAYIQLPEGYNAEDIDATSILLNETIQPILDPKYDFVTNPSEYLVNHDDDGILERMVKFDRAEVETLLSVGEATLTITGKVSETPFEGSDAIRVIGKMLTLIGPWSGAEMDSFLPVLERFEALSGINVAYKVLGGEDLATLLSAQFAAGTTPGDVIFMSFPLTPWWITQQAQNGHILEVTDLIDESDFFTGVLDRVKVGNTLYGGSFTGSAKPGFWYRKSFFAANGLTPPNTWDEFNVLLENIASIPGVINPIASGDAVGWPLSDVTEHFLITFGGPQLHRDLTTGATAWNSSTVRTIFANRLVPLLEDGYFGTPLDWGAVVNSWWNGDFGLYFMGSWIINMVDNRDDLGVFTLPGAEGLVFGCDYFFIPAYTEYPKEAKLLFQFLASEEAQRLKVSSQVGQYVGRYATNINVPYDAYLPVDIQVVELMVGKELLPDLDDTIGGQFQGTFWDQMKLLWVDPTQLDNVLNALEAVAP